MNIGDIVTRLPVTFGGQVVAGRHVRGLFKGKVVYIHPQGRFHIVEFSLPSGKIRESFFGI